MPLSKKNPRVQAARRLGVDARERAEAGAFLIEGPKLVQEALEAGVILREAFASPSLATRPGGDSLARELSRLGIPVHEVDEKTLTDVVALENAQGIAAIASIPRPAGPDPLLEGSGDLLIASTVQDPGNAGALVRIAAAAGFAGVVADRQTADFYSPKAVRGSAGAVLRLPAMRVDDLAGFARGLASRGWAVLGAATRGGEDPATIERPVRIALVLGGEGRGIPEPLAGTCTGMVTIPMASGVESLNVAAAAAVLAFDLRRRR